MFVLPALARHTSQLTIDMKKFLFLRSLTAEVEFDNGIILGRRASMA